MAIEGPLRELGIHDVFQLLDLSRKTGTLRVTSALRDNEGTVYFDAGKIVSAAIKSNPYPFGAMLLKAGKISEGDLTAARAAQTERGDRRRLGEILLAMGAITSKELERQVRLQVEAVVFEMMSWREGFFRFEEGSASAMPVDSALRISTESVLMEAARRIDEWSRIADRVPSLAHIPRFAPADPAHQSQLDLLPSEWEVLTSIDGEHDLRSIAVQLSRSEFDVAKVMYGLISTGVVELRAPSRATSGGMLPIAEPESPAPAMSPLADGTAALKRGDLREAARIWSAALAADGAQPESARVREALTAALTLQALMEDARG